MSSGGWVVPFLLTALLWAALISPSRSLVNEEFDALEAFKRSIKEDPFSCLASWNSSHSGPCGWFGVACSDPQDHVVALKLFNCSLEGTLAPEIAFFLQMKELNLNGNSFSGLIPKEIGLLKTLNLLDLGNNLFSGSIPPEIGGLASISKICLSNNHLNGSIPPQMGNLTSLEELRIDRNRLSGEIPATNKSYLGHGNKMIGLPANVTGLCLLNQLNVGDFSFNFFTGEIPSCLAYLQSSSFQRNCFKDRAALFQRSNKECDTEVDAPTPSVSSKAPDMAGSEGMTPSKHQRAQQPHWLFILELATGSVLVTLILIFLFSASRMRKPESSIAFPWINIKKSRDDAVISIDNKMKMDVQRLSRQELELACEDFSNIIYSSSDIKVYKGILEEGVEIAVTSLFAAEDYWISYHDIHFQCEMENLARLNHENVAKLLGYCEEKEPFSRMLIFEYESNGTLYEHLHYGGECPLSWSRRMRIAIGIAQGLKYIHTELQPPFTLSSLSSSSVYLTEEFSPKLVDFECWKAVLSKPEKSGLFIGQGSLQGRRESLQRRHMDVQDTTQSFGVLLLEIISGRIPYCKDRGSLLDWAVQYLEKPSMICHLVDPQLRHFNHEHLQIICNVISLCVQSDPSKRPSMDIIAAMLENGIGTETIKESHLAWAELALSS